MKKYGVIMAGGEGTRFWPLSRKGTPKQLLNLTGNEIMINEAIDRLSYTVDKKDIFIVTNSVQEELMRKTTEGRIEPDHILLEPSARNTAACVGYAAMEIRKKYGDGVMIITPSDAYVKNTAAFTRTLTEAVNAAEESDKLVTIGITPTFPATGYGYMKFDRMQDVTAKSVISFKEKPDEETAREYLSTDHYLWNSGMFVWKTSAILKRFEQFIPDIYAQICEIGNAMGTKEERGVIADRYQRIRKISIDYAIMEPSAEKGDVLVVPGEFGWSDVGTWEMMEVLHDKDEQGNITLGDVVAVNTTNSIIYSDKKLVAAVSIDNLVIVDTPDTVMVCRKDRTQDVKLIVDTLRERDRKELL